ncbi:threonine-phosphate decarboxylase [Natranaerovirga pectinivora]|uniref:Aminotransferase n=1 Tax=Natranaerovirga pectinivora TaxID=682400 RepID=A0A4R3MML7_9FIRM|nr:histidinol-phosphate transaminase [Natranaerovirga pectinivora]TCT14277.1 threonine-phosphate decarboxylase [Natranaerovirga pectinivora]
MNTNNNHFHGSDLEKIEQIYQISKEAVINYSSNVNPLGISPLLKNELASNIDIITTYPDRDYTNLRKSIGDYCETNYENIIVGNGSTELISLVMHLKKPKNAIIIGPTYSEYEREIALTGGASYYFPLEEENHFEINIENLNKQLTKEIDLLVICNPNNPTSTAITQSSIRSILDHCKKNNVFVMIDETYVEFSEDINVISAVPLTEFYNNLIILRGISKFFAAPGLRLGYGICSNEDLIKEMNAKQNPWAINTLASFAGEIMFSDQAYITETKNLIASERKRIFETMSHWDSVKVYNPSANFLLVKLLDPSVTSTMVFEYLVRKNIMVRDCSSFPFLNDRFIRFCFLKPRENDLLLEALNEFLNTTS